MHIWSNDSLDPSRAEELFIDLIDSGSEMNVWSLRVFGEEAIFFEVHEHGDSLDVVEKAFQARREFKESFPWE